MNKAIAVRTCLHLAGCCAASVLGFGLAAQAGDESAFLRQQAARLHKYASTTFQAGYPSMARPIWLEILAEYDKDHGDARAALGYVKFNTTWSPQDGFVYPEGDNPATAAAGKVERSWAAVARTVGAAHKKVAKEFAGAGRTDRADYHMARALRFLPDDAEVQAAMGHKQFAGMSGTDIEATLFERSRQMDAIIARERKKDYEVRALAEAQPTFLTAAGRECTGVRSEHFTIWGEFPPEVLMEGARYAERSLAFCKEVLVGDPNFRAEGVKARTFVFLAGPDSYRSVLEATPQLIPDAKRREFIRTHAAATTFAAGGVSYEGFGPPDAPTLHDGCVRFVARQYGGLRADAMNAGLGHAVVGRFLGQNRLFTIAPAKGTVTGGDRKLLLPDLDTWAELAIEAAFDPRGTKAAQLPLLQASRFPTDGRIKAWSFCDYLLRRDPKLLAELDRCRGERNPDAVESAFTRKTGVPLARLEQEWKDFWTGASPVLAALRNRAPALHMVSKGGKSWLDAFNKARLQHGADAVSWNASYSRNCHQHVEYLEANRKARGPADEHRQRDGNPGATTNGSIFASMALVVAKGTPARATADWIDIPGYRDALINPYLRTVGIYAEGPIAVFDVVRGMELPRKIKTGVYPPANSVDRPNRIDVKRLGPAAAAELESRKIRAKSIGYPISMHSWRTSSLPASVEAEVRQGGAAVAGFVLARSGHRYSDAPGLAVFYPLEPLASGVKVTVVFKSQAGKALANWAFTPR